MADRLVKLEKAVSGVAEIVKDVSGIIANSRELKDSDTKDVIIEESKLESRRFEEIKKQRQEKKDLAKQIYDKALKRKYDEDKLGLGDKERIDARINDGKQLMQDLLASMATDENEYDAVKTQKKKDKKERKEKRDKKKEKKKHKKDVDEVTDAIGAQAIASDDDGDEQKQERKSVAREDSELRRKIICEAFSELQTKHATTGPDGVTRVSYTLSEQQEVLNSLLEKHGLSLQGATQGGIQGV